MVNAFIRKRLLFFGRTVALLLLFCEDKGEAYSSKEKYPLVICAIFQDESLFLKEWIEYHRLVGVDHFYLYDNLSTDDSRALLEPYLAANIVELIDWPVVTFDQNTYLKHVQLSAYNHALRTVKETARWVAFIDIDEFLVPLKHANLPEMLSDYQSYAGLAVNWQVFGHGDLTHLPEGELLTEHLVYKAPAVIGMNEYVKLIVQPDYVKQINHPHAFEFYEGYFAVASDGAPLNPNQKGKPVLIDVIQLNHYWFGTKEWFYDLKLPRRKKWGFNFNAAHLEEWQKISNQETDTSIFRFLPQLKENLSKLEMP